MADEETIVFPRLGPGATTAAWIHRPSGLVTPPESTWHRRPVTLDRRAHVVLRGNDVRVDLQVERRNGWRVAGIPLYAVGPWGVAAQPLELMKALAAEVRSRRPYGADRVLAALDRHVALVRRTPDRLDLSPFASQIKGRMARIVDELS